MRLIVTQLPLAKWFDSTRIHQGKKMKFKRWASALKANKEA